MFRSKFFRDNLAFLSCVVLGGLLGYLFHFVISRRLSVEQYGEFQAIISVMAVFSVVLTSFSFFIIKNSAVFFSHDDRDGQAHFVVFVEKKFRPILLLFSFIYLVLMPVVKNILHLDNYLGLLIIGLSIVISFYFSLYNNSLQGWGYFFTISFIGVITALIKLISAYALTFISHNVSVIVWSLFISSVFGWMFLKKYFQKNWLISKMVENSNDWREKYFKEADFRKTLVYIAFFSLGLALVNSADILFVKSIASPQLAGYYGAMSVIGKIILWMNLAVIGVLFPDACTVGYKGEPARISSILGSYGLILGISLPIVALYFLFPEFFVGLMFGNQYLPMASNLWIFGAMAFFLSLLTLEAKVALARYDFKSTGLLMIISILLFLSILMARNNIHLIVIYITVTFFLGWMMLFSMNLWHRFQYAKVSKNLDQ